MFVCIDVLTQNIELHPGGEHCRTEKGTEKCPKLEFTRSLNNRGRRCGQMDRIKLI